TQSSHDKDVDEVPDKEDKGVCKGSGIDDQDLTESSTQDVNTAELSINIATININTDLPNDKRAIRTKWIFKNKKDERGIVVRNKARLVAQGYTQEEGIDYDETASTLIEPKKALIKDAKSDDIDMINDWIIDVLNSF
nr:retrovirus-related Pol polyprotein from transposon TNT 1-94 [Tanacetum cinerariifolium]